ncbi:MAG: hypothetical protein B6I36_10035 [Desulfobacteraceae bacterium 4572_35.1]|nr:MAG: hypothetical protein B6I36_10035 [Desulfobacteraceae bacterium 4572_35.1]
MKISLFRGGYQTTQTDETIEDWDEFVDLVTTPEIGQKNGDYFIRGFCDGARSDGNMQSVDLIIIDGDQTLDNGSSCVPLVTAHNVIKENGYTHVIYNSFSNDLTNNIHKWRLVIPCPDITDKQDLAQGVEEVITLLHERGVMVRNVVENNTTSQPWFLPRCNEACFEDFDYRYYDKNEYRLTGFTRPSAIFNAVESGKSLDEGQGIFSWDYVTSQFKEGTLHMGLKSACGWLILTTDWADSQIKQHLCALVEAICPDRDKVDRACNKGEIDSLIKYCRGKSGTSITAVANWKDHLISADELKGKVFPPVKWAVDGVIPEGLTVLAGDPKAGKSLMAVDICNAIASGGEAFGKQACVQGDVVYISLEDPQRRVQDRIKQQCDLWPGAFHLVDAA